MRKPIISGKASTNHKLSVNPQTQSRSSVQSSDLDLDRRLRQKRSSNYVKSMSNLDAGGVHCDRAKVQQLIRDIHNELPELAPAQYPIGIIAKCYLGMPFEVHTLDCTLEIIHHYKKGEPLPNMMEKARSLAIHPIYTFIEIYSDRMLAVKENGEVSVIKR